MSAQHTPGALLALAERIEAIWPAPRPTEKDDGSYAARATAHEAAEVLRLIAKATGGSA